LPDKRVIRARFLATDRPRFFMYDNRLERASADFALAYSREVQGLRFGVALGGSFLAGAAGTGTTFVLRQNASFELADADIGADLPWQTAPKGSAFVEWGDWTLGASVRGPLYFELAFGTLADIEIAGLQGGDVVTSIVARDFYTPLKLALGGSRDLSQWTLHAALEFHRWSAAPIMTPTATVSVDIFGFSPTVPQGSPAPQFFKDVYVPRLGAERRVPLEEWEMTFRAGTFFEPSPIAKGDKGLFLDADRLGMSIGAGLTSVGPVSVLPQPLSLDAHVTYIQLLGRTFTPDSVTASQPEIAVAGFIWSAGLTTTLRF